MSFGPIRRRRIDLFVGAAFQIFEIRKYSSGLKRGPAAIFRQYTIFKTASGVCSWKSFEGWEENDEF